MLKAIIIKEMNIDISKYPKLVGFLKRKNDDYKPKKFKVLDAKNIEEFLERAPDQEFLPQKVVFFNIIFILM